MYHNRKATERLDKVYALSGMSTDDPDVAGLKVDYGASWKDVFQKLVHFCLSDQMSLSTWDGDEELAVVEAKGCVLGEVSLAEEGATGDDRQRVEITWKNAMRHSNTEGKQSSRFAFRASAKPIKKGDIICLLQGASTPTIVRPHDGFSTIIMITVPLTHDLLQRSASITSFPTGLLLIWDWDEPRRKSQGGEDYEDYVSSRGVAKCPKTECQCQDHLDKATRLWTSGLLLNGTGQYGEAVENLRKAVEVYGTGAALRSVDNTHHGHGPWREVDEKVLMILDDLLISDKGMVIEAKYKRHGRTLLWWAAKEGRETVVRMLLENGADVHTKDDDKTLLLWAAGEDRETFVRMLLENGADVNAEDGDGRTPLLEATGYGHEAVVRVLLENGADVNAEDGDGQTPLWWAARYGHEAVVQMLLENGADVNAEDGGGHTPLWWAAKNRHGAVAKLLESWNPAVVSFHDLFL